jgi:poly-gamma-glutamate synthesis protein (capsule biosynthesis protein)
MKLALAGDTMLGRKVAERLAVAPHAALFSEEVLAVSHEADLFVLNLECAISDRGSPWPNPYKPFFFRAPPVATEVLRLLGVSCVTLANNHALDFGPDALLDTFRHLSDAGIAWVGAGADEAAARTPALLEQGGTRVAVVGVTDHPSEYAAAPDRPGVAYADLRRKRPRWLLDTMSSSEADIVVVSPHWGPNMVADPVAHVREAAAAFRAAGATLVAGHSAHVFHGVADGVLYDLGDFIDDYTTDRRLRNDLGLLFLVNFEDTRPVRLEAVPLALDYCHTRVADPDEAGWIRGRFREACAAFGTDVSEHAGRLIVDLAPTYYPIAGSGILRPPTRSRKGRLMDSKVSEPLHDDDNLGPAAGERRASLDADVDEEEEPDLEESDLEEAITWIEAEEGAEEEEPEAEKLDEGELKAEEPEIVELEEEEPEEVEVSLDELLRARFEGEERIEYEQEEEKRPVLVTAGEEEPRPRAADEFVCQSCFLIKNRRQLANTTRSICKDCANGR